MEELASTFTGLAKYGEVGVMLALIILCAGTVYALWKMACNHIEHTNDIFMKNTEALTQLISAQVAMKESQERNTLALDRLINKL